MIDLKPDAPAEVRGEFKPIATKVPGLRIGELMPKVAGIADKFAFIRSLVGSAGAHDAFQCQSGFPAAEGAQVTGRPSARWSRSCAARPTTPPRRSWT